MKGNCANSTLGADWSLLDTEILPSIQSIIFVFIIGFLLISQLLLISEFGTCPLANASGICGKTRMTFSAPSKKKVVEIILVLMFGIVVCVLDW